MDNHYVYDQNKLYPNEILLFKERVERCGSRWIPGLAPASAATSFFFVLLYFLCLSICFVFCPQAVCFPFFLLVGCIHFELPRLAAGNSNVEGHGARTIARPQEK